MAVRHFVISLLLVSWAALPACGRPEPAAPVAARETTPAAAATPPPAAQPAAAVSPEGAWFVETGCSRCHAVSVYGVQAEAPVGPDLAIAVEEVQTRFGVTLEEFMDQPTGTMALVLSSQITLTPEQKKVAIEKLHKAFEARKAAGPAAAQQ